VSSAGPAASSAPLLGALGAPALLTPGAAAVSELASESLTQRAWCLVPGLGAQHRAAPAVTGGGTEAEPA